MDTSHINLIKLSVGSESVEQLLDWQRNRSKQRSQGAYFHLTRMWPKREAEIVAGGSIYWVIQGLIQARQRIIRLEEVIGQDGIRRCGIVLHPDVIRTEATPKRPFQGWRYLLPKDAPQDLPENQAGNTDHLPPALLAALSEIGVR